MKERVLTCVYIVFLAYADHVHCSISRARSLVARAAKRFSSQTKAEAALITPRRSSRSESWPLRACHFAFATIVRHPRGLKEGTCLSWSFNGEDRVDHVPFTLCVKFHLCVSVALFPSTIESQPS